MYCGKSARSKIRKEVRRLKLKEKQHWSSIFKNRFPNAHALLGANKDLTNLCKRPKVGVPVGGLTVVSLDINFITQKNK